MVSYDARGTEWILSIADNGVGKSADGASEAKAGLGTSIVQALAKELDACVDFFSNKHGTTVSIKHASANSIPRPGD